jgi:hypothetical protein
VIAQTFSTTTVNLLIETGRSHSILAVWAKADSGAPAVFYTFRRFADERDRDVPASIRYGSGLLEVCGNPAEKLIGPYWTDNQTVGTVQFIERNRKVCTEYSQAAALTYRSNECVDP